MNPFHLIGDPETVLAFTLGGVPGQAVRSAADARAAVDLVVKAVGESGGPLKQPTLLLITFATAARIRDHLDTVMLDAHAPLILEIPGFNDPPQAGPVDRVVDRVLGVHL